MTQDNLATEVELPPAIFNHCQSVYSAMYERSTLTGEVRIFKGFTTHLFKDLGLAVPYYTSVMSLLKLMDCVRQVRRGGSTTPSEWALLQEPTMELFNAVGGPSQPDTTSGVSRARGNAQMLHDLNRRVSSLETRMNDAEELLGVTDE